MTRFFNTRWKIALWLLVVALLIAAGIYLAGQAPPLTIDTSQGEAQIFFQADRATVIFSGECLEVRWQVEHIKEVYLNGDPEVGQGSRDVCVYAGALPTLRVVLQDGTAVEYPLEIAILFVSPLVNLLALIAFLLAFGGAYLLTPAPLRALARTRAAQVLSRAILPTIIVTLITLLLLEFGLRSYFSTFGSRNEKIMYLYTRQEIQAQADIVQPMPYLNYIPSPDYPDHNRLGYRGPEITIPKPEGVFRIVAIGGSTTYSTGTTAANPTRLCCRRSSTSPATQMSRSSMPG